MILTYEKIREVKLNEKGEKLQELPPDFFANAFKYINIKKGTIEEESAKSLVFSIFQLRLRKIANLAYYFYKSDKLPDNLEEDEEKLYMELVGSFRKHFERFRKNFEKSLEQKVEEDEEADKKEKGISPNKSKIRKVRFIQEVPEIFLPSQGTCSFKEGEERELQKEEADLLLSKGFCEKVS